MVKNVAGSASNLQVGTDGEMELQDYGVPQQWDDRPGLVSGKSGSGEKLLLLAAAAVPAVMVRCADMEADVYNGVDAVVMETILCLLKSCCLTSPELTGYISPAADGRIGLRCCIGKATDLLCYTSG